MQKVYKLLRNNQETGPFTLEDILLLNLKPFDLVWVEGRSAAWRYPSEIETLKPYVPGVPQPQNPFEPRATADLEAELIPAPAPAPKAEVSKKIFVSMPEHAQQASQIRQMETRQETQPGVEKKTEIISTPPPSIKSQFPETETIQTNYSRPLNDVEEDYASWVYRQKTKKKTNFSKKDLLIAAAILLLIAGGYFIISKPAIVQPIAEQKTTPVQVSETQLPVTSQIETPDPEKNNNSSTIKTIQKKKKAAGLKVIPAVNTSPNAGAQNDMHKEVATTVDTGNPVPGVEKEVIQKEKTPAESKEKKKKFGESIRGIFSKKDSKEKTVLDEPKPATDRQSTKRNTDSEPANETNREALAGMIDINSNAPDNWMMGVSGLKLTIRNRNNLVLQTVAVQVLYYDENNQLLDKKSVNFNNVPAKGRATMAAPDHKFADHVEFKLLSVSAREDQYASN